MSRKILLIGGLIPIILIIIALLLLLKGISQDTRFNNDDPIEIYPKLERIQNSSFCPEIYNEFSLNIVYCNDDGKICYIRENNSEECFN